MTPALREVPRDVRSGEEAERLPVLAASIGGIRRVTPLTHASVDFVQHCQCDGNWPKGCPFWQECRRREPENFLRIMSAWEELWSYMELPR